MDGCNIAVVLCTIIIIILIVFILCSQWLCVRKPQHEKFYDGMWYEWYDPPGRTRRFMATLEADRDYMLE